MRIGEYPILGQARVELSALSRRDIRQQNILLPGQPHAGTELRDHRAQPATQTLVASIPDAPILNVETKEPLAIALLVPAQMILYIAPGQWTRVLHAPPQAALQFNAEPGDAALGHQILHAAVLPIRPRAASALQGHYPLRHCYRP